MQYVIASFSFQLPDLGKLVILSRLDDVNIDILIE